jgi:hypothetical protein
MVAAVSSSNYDLASIQIKDRSAPQRSNVFTVKNAAIVVGGILLFSGVAAGTGRLLQLGGAQLLSHPSALSALGRTAMVAGDKLFLVGKGAFLSVAVPVYTITWVVPKWIATVGIPKGAALAHRYILIPMAEGIVKVSAFLNESLAKTAQAIYRHVLQPFGRIIDVTAKWIWKTVIVPAADKIAQFGVDIYHQVLAPLSKTLASVSQWVWNSAIVPGVDLIVKGVQAVFDRVVQPLGQFMAHAAKWIWNSAIVPGADLFAKGVQAVFDRALQPLGQLTANAATWLWNSAIIPGADFFAKGVQAVFDRALQPLGQLTAKAAKWIWEAALVPVAKHIAQATHAIKMLVERVSTAVYQTLIVPAAKVVGQAASETANAIRDAASWFVGRISLQS